VHKSYAVLMQTDRSVYKPGSKIQFRCVVLDSRLKPTANRQLDLYITVSAVVLPFCRPLDHDSRRPELVVLPYPLPPTPTVPSTSRSTNDNTATSALHFTLSFALSPQKPRFFSSTCCSRCPFFGFTFKHPVKIKITLWYLFIATPKATR
jgi:hypothetical protein